MDFVMIFIWSTTRPIISFYCDVIDDVNDDELIAILTVIALLIAIY